MRVILSLSLVFTMMIPALQAQDVVKDTSYWKKGAVGTLGFTDTGFGQYWQAGGVPSFSILARVAANATYEKAKDQWASDLLVAYGRIRQGRGSDLPFIKNEDRLELNSKYGRKLRDKLLLSANLNFRTQFDLGYEFQDAFPNLLDSATVISQAFAPAYLNFGLGLDWQPTPDLSITYSPVNSKVTIVTIEDLRSRYMPDDVMGSTRYELGSNLGIKYKRALAENISFQTSANFFTNYLAGEDSNGNSQLGNVDVNWETLTAAKVNDWLAITFATNLIYDDDIRFDLVDDAGSKTGGKGPRTQFQRILTVGLTYTFIK